uniref:RRM domain-containing protein n=1 Tax=Neobodo designis TaxID=312471 RepID=A0A7S1LG61_NEODS|mmetsp:Transcript_21570/g.66924  ORF Transcript_21570/g.66924 Transcript_21570/m.66924 type:complete len:446 (+) Transcript_21570:272-1609(+)
MEHTGTSQMPHPACQGNTETTTETPDGAFAPNKGSNSSPSQTQSSGSRTQASDARGSSSADSEEAQPRRDGAHRRPDAPLSNAPPPQASPPAPVAGSNLFVAGLARTVDDEALERTFARFGAVLSAKVMLRVSTGASRGFGFVLFQRAADADAARAALDGTTIDGHEGTLQVSVSKHRGENLTAESRVVYVRNVPASVGRAASTLAEFFGGFGEVLRQQVNSQPDLPPRPGMKSAGPLTVAVVTFGTIEAARACVAACHGKRPFAQCVVPLLSKMEEPQTLRERRMREQRAQRPKKAAGATPARAPSSSASSRPETRDHGDPDAQHVGGGAPAVDAARLPAPATMPSTQAAPGAMPPPQLPPTAPWWPGFAAMPPPPFPMLSGMPPPMAPMPPPTPTNLPGYDGAGAPWNGPFLPPFAGRGLDTVAGSQLQVPACPGFLPPPWPV